jgi:DNA-binding transcriptional LysR family regulator
MDVDRLRTLSELADRGTVVAVADALSMTPSAVSQQLKVLAREAGVPLVEPDGRRLRLTDAGAALVLRADEVISALDRATAEMAAYRGSAHGRVRMAMFPSGLALLLPGVLKRLANSDVTIQAADVNETVEAIPALLADYDVMISHRDEKAPEPTHPRVHFESLMREPIDLVLSPEHRLASQRVIRLEDVADEPWISVRKGFVVDDVLEYIGAATGVRPRVVQRINDFQVISALVAAGNGIALMPRFVARHRDLVQRPLKGFSPARVYLLATRPAALRSHAISTAIDALREEARAVSQSMPTG